MMEIITIANEKGGVGKTTTIVNLAYYLAYEGQSVLIVDFDPQANATKHLGVTHNATQTIYDILEIGESPSYDYDGFSSFENKNGKSIIKLINSDKKLLTAEALSFNLPAKEMILKQSLETYLENSPEKYDIVLIDSPGKPGFLTNNAIMASTQILITSDAKYLGLDAISEFLETLSFLRKRCAFSPSLIGILIVMYSHRRRLHRDVVESVEKKLPNLLFDTKIRENVSIAESPSHGLPIGAYKPKSIGAADYQAFTIELLERLKQKKELRNV